MCPFCHGRFKTRMNCTKHMQRHQEDSLPPDPPRLDAGSGQEGDDPEPVAPPSADVSCERCG